MTSQTPASGAKALPAKHAARRALRKRKSIGTPDPNAAAARIARAMHWVIS
jgi:hypothetical protein